MAAPHDICIRGAGIVGRSLALLLARERLRVALVAPPSHPDARADVRAYALSPAARALLQSLRCWPPEPAATPVLAMEVQADQHGAVHFSAAEQGVPALNWIVDVPTLERQLAEAVGYHSGIDTVVAPVPAPLTVVCEGRASATRAELGVDFDTTRYPQHALATRLDCERPHGQVARQWFTPEGDILAFLPLGGPQGRQVAVVWSVRSEAAPALAALDDAALAARLAALSGGALGALQVQGARAAWPLIKACRGGVFVLCTSLRAMKRIHELIEDKLSAYDPDRPLLMQGQATRSELLERHRAAGNAVLVASQSFWEGVDVRGDALQLVIIDKLPFAPPDDPVLSARIEHMKREGRNAFMDYQLPHAVISMKQGAGRLIRDELDHGVLMVCDPRLIDKHYGKTIWRSLPPMRRTRSEEVVVGFLESLGG